MIYRFFRMEEMMEGHPLKECLHYSTFTEVLFP